MNKTVKKTVKKKIRKSHIAVLTGLALVLLIILGFIVAARIMAGPAQGWDVQRSSRGEGEGAAVIFAEAADMRQPPGCFGCSEIP